MVKGSKSNRSKDQKYIYKCVFKVHLNMILLSLNIYERLQTLNLVRFSDIVPEYKNTHQSSKIVTLKMVDKRKTQQPSVL